MLTLLRAGLIGSFVLAPVLVIAAPFVPGTGEFLPQCSDNFEDESWSYRLNLPKSSYEQDDNQRAPGGVSSNQLWHEGAKRGTPDVVKRVATPPGGLAGSTGALLMQTKNSGIPGRLSGQQQQDDLLMKVDRKLGRVVPVTWQPSCTVRVYVRPFEEWENRTGASFGMRADCRGKMPEGKTAAYWPGMFILFRSENSSKVEADFAQISIRANGRGQDISSVEIREPGWWTLGMSFTPDGQIHYYASEGVDDLTEADYLASNYAYNYQCQCFSNFFFNVANWDNGQTWSTPWVIDDPKVFVIPPAGETVASLPRRKGQRVPTFPITHIHDADKPKSNNPFSALFGGSRSAGRGSSRR
ncbi:hypothetical protein [Botrimarina hoheduenensis]|uniref:Uncharacterized protein n=1 Tax=Botrimarina hoheduenensis TaxID=2528000 RepID=A0A5C5WEB6_9BACT|nr:hypothetical protein [Botrimarina hoheduenensis]TWT48409.1 hypothetical protein Pla111_01760 [Botrimarina hoheduenensis]